MPGNLTPRSGANLPGIPSSWSAEPAPELVDQPTQMFDVTAALGPTTTPVVVAPAPEPELPEAPPPPRRSPRQSARSGPTLEAAPEPEPEIALGTRRITPHERGARGRRGGHPPRPPGASARRSASAARRCRAADPAGPAASPRCWRSHAVVFAGWFLVLALPAVQGRGPRPRRRPGPPRRERQRDRRPADREEASLARRFFFRLRAKLSGSGPEDIKSGRFILQKDMTYGDAIEALAKTPPAAAPSCVTIPEGSAGARSRRSRARRA